MQPLDALFRKPAPPFAHCRERGAQPIGHRGVGQSPVAGQDDAGAQDQGVRHGVDRERAVSCSCCPSVNSMGGSWRPRGISKGLLLSVRPILCQSYLRDATLVAYFIHLILVDSHISRTRQIPPVSCATEMRRPCFRCGVRVMPRPAGCSHRANRDRHSVDTAVSARGNAPRS